MKLYGSETSPFVRKARIVLIEKQLACDFVIALPAAPDSPLPTLNPLGQIPVLERDDGSTLFDSPIIVDYLDSLKAPALIPPNGEARWQVLRWAALADGMMDQGVARVQEFRRPPAQQSPEAMRARELKIARALDFAERHVGAGPYLVEARLTLADLALACAIDYTDFRYPHDWRERCPRLTAWFSKIRERPSFAQTQPK
jgi:glutathione S-transferase